MQDFVWDTLPATIQRLKRGLVVVRKLVVDDFWLAVNDDWASCE